MEPDRIKKMRQVLKLETMRLNRWNHSAYLSGLVLFQCDAHDLQTELFLFFVPDQECDLL